MSKHKVVAFAMFMGLLLAACGQKPGVHILGAGGGFGGPQAPGGYNPGGSNPGGSNPGGSNPGNPNQPGSTYQPGNPNEPGNNNPGSGSGGDTTGVTDKTITIGIHAPVTGAAPIKANAFDVGKDLYWNWLKGQKKDIYGRTVKVVFADDHYNPQTAQTVCDQMASVDHAFLLIGAAGTDQIAQCAFYSNQRGIPYLSAGVTKTGTNFNTYFGLTMTYPDQMPILAQYVRKLGSGEDRYSANGLPQKDNVIKVAMVSPDTPNFADARDALQRAISSLGAPYEFKAFLVSKDEAPGDAPAVVQNIKQWGADIISPITAPVFVIALAQATGNQQYFPRYVGVGVTNAINQATQNECQQNQFGGNGKPNAMFFSPWPGWAQRDQYDKNFEKQVAATPGAADIDTAHGGGDLMWSLWGIMKQLQKMFLAAGPNLTRQGFINTMRSYSTNGQFTDFGNLKFSPTNRWGAYQVHALVADCSPGNEQWVEDPNNPGLHSGY